MNESQYKVELYTTMEQLQTHTEYVPEVKLAMWLPVVFRPLGHSVQPSQDLHRRTYLGACLNVAVGVSVVMVMLILIFFLMLVLAFLMFAVGVDFNVGAVDVAVALDVDLGVGLDLDVGVDVG